jgi:hypothetical protein
MVPTKPFGKPGGMPGAMTGGGRNMPLKSSDGLSALQARLSGAKKNKAMKPPTTKGRQKQDISSGVGKMLP